MRIIKFLPIILILVSLPAFAGDFQFNAAATSTTYDEATDANSWGMTVRAQYNFTHADDTWLINYYGPAISVAAGEIGAGYLLKTHGDFYVEGGLGLFYSVVRGPGPLAIAGFGFNVSQNVYLDFPVILTYAVVFVPYIGFSF